MEEVEVPVTGEESNPYGFEALITHGTGVSYTILGILVLMSLVSWYIIFTKLWDQRRVRKQYEQTQKNFWNVGNLREGVSKLPGKGHIFRGIAEDGMKAADHHEGRLTDQIPLHEWITASLQRSVDEVTGYLGKGMSFLATVGSTSPFVGLFGTVWGIYNALISIGLAGQASIDKVAGPVGEALIMTAIGLFVAVPAVMGYNWLLGRNKDLVAKVSNFATDIHSYLVSGSRVETSAPARPAPAAPAARK